VYAYEGNTQVWRKVMAGYHQGDDLHIVTCGLTACTPGSAPGLMLGNEYKKLYFYLSVLCDV